MVGATVTAAAAVAAVALPGLLKPEPVLVFSSYGMAPQGIPYHVDNSCDWFGAPLRTDLACPPDRVYFINTRAWTRDGETFYRSELEPHDFVLNFQGRT